MKYINQLDYPHVLYKTGIDIDRSANPKYAEYEKRPTAGTFSAAGCGLACAVMAIDQLFVDKEFTVGQAVRLSYECHANGKPGTAYTIFGPAFAQKFDLDYKATSDREELLHCLRTGGVAVCNSGGDREGYTGVFTHGGHYILAIAEDRDGNIVILDPSYKEGKYEEEGRKGKVVVKDNVFAVTSLDVLAEDCANRSPSFYLFWHK